MLTIKEEYSQYWEIHELEVDWGKLEALHSMFEDMSVSFQSLANVSVRVPPHTIIRLAQGPISIDDIHDLAKSAIMTMVYNNSGSYKVKSGHSGRMEVYSDTLFMVCKSWIKQKGQVDLISAGIRGRRTTVANKVAKFGISKNSFEKMSNEQKRTLLR